MKIAEFLKSENIFEFALLPYSSLKITDLRRNERMKERFEVKSAVVFLMPYYVEEEKTNLSRYARPRDYHLYIKELSARAEKVLDCDFFCFADTSPVDEVGAAIMSGLGCVGVNGLIINRRYGSYVFIGEFFFPFDVDHPFFEGIEKRRAGERCLSCGACVKACKTGGIFNRELCVSCINQKKKITDAEAEIIKASGLAWGCDECQEICPMNHGEETPIEFFRNNRILSLDRETVEGLVESGELQARAFAWRGEGVLLRNIDILK